MAFTRFVTRRAVVLSASLVALSAVAGCHKTEMDDQPRFDPQEPTMLFTNGASARPLVNGTVTKGPGGQLNDDTVYPTTPLDPATDQAGFPFALTRDDLERGQTQFNIFCSPCHGRQGDGNGMIVMRGFPRPPSFYSPRLVDAKPGHFYNVITHGYGAMYSYHDRIDDNDRWRIAAYVRALQAGAKDDKTVSRYDPNNQGSPTGRIGADYSPAPKVPAGQPY